MGAFETAMDVYISYKFCRLLSSSSAVTVYSRYKSPLGLIQLRSLWGSTFVLRYYSLGGNTAMPGGLYDGLYRIFLVVIVLQLVQQLHMCNTCFYLSKDRLYCTCNELFSPLGKLADRAIYFTFRNFFFSFLCRQIISGSTGPIFAIFETNNRYLFEYDRSGSLF